MELQAVILAAGQGSRMLQLTSSVPKALIPVANKPLVWYPVQMLEKAGFEEAIIIVQENHHHEIQKALEHICQVSLRLVFATVPSGQDWGTAQSLRHIQDKIKTDILLLSCDVITNLPLHSLVDIHRKNDATVTMLLAHALDFSEAAVPGGKGNRTIERDVFGLDEKGERVLFMTTEADLDEAITLKRSFLNKHPVVNFRTNLMDAHCYILKKQIVDFLSDNKTVMSSKGQTEWIDSVKADLLPYLVNSQFSAKSKSGKTDDSAPKDIMSYLDGDKYTELTHLYTTWKDDRCDKHSRYHDNNIRCSAYITENSFCIRANSLVTYCEATRQVPNHLATLCMKLPAMIHPSVSVPRKSTVGSDSMVGQGTTIGEKSLIKHSFIGQHCTIGEKVKITNSVIMDYTTVEEGCDISGSVVCPNVHISNRCELKDCLCSKKHIHEMGKHTNEVITELDQMMEVA